MTKKYIKIDNITLLSAFEDCISSKNKKDDVLLRTEVLRRMDFYKFIVKAVKPNKTVKPKNK